MPSSALLQQLLVGRLDRAAGDRLDHLVALVQALLDQRIAGERADDVEARHVGLVARAHLRVAGAALGQFDAAGFQELARRVGAEAGEHQIAGVVLRAVGRLERDRAGPRPSPARPDRRIAAGRERIAFSIAIRLPVLARANSGCRLTMMTWFCSASAIAFSIAASPAPITTMLCSARPWGRRAGTGPSAARRRARRACAGCPAGRWRG